MDKFDRDMEEMRKKLTKVHTSEKEEVIPEIKVCQFHHILHILNVLLLKQETKQSVKKTTLSPRLVTIIPLKELKIGEIIGEGGQSTVFHAQWKGMQVVFKKIRQKQTSDVKKEFYQEFEIWMYVSLHYFFLFHSSFDVND